MLMSCANDRDIFCKLFQNLASKWKKASKLFEQKASYLE